MEGVWGCLSFAGLQTAITEVAAAVQAPLQLVKEVPQAKSLLSLELLLDADSYRDLELYRQRCQALQATVDYLAVQVEHMELARDYDKAMQQHLREALLQSEDRIHALEAALLENDGDMRALRAQKADLHVTIANQQQQTEQVRKQALACKRETDLLRLRATGSQSDIERLTAQLHASKQQADRVSAELAASQQRADALSAQLEASRERVDLLSGQVEQVHQEGQRLIDEERERREGLGWEVAALRSRLHHAARQEGCEAQRLKVAQRVLDWWRQRACQHHARVVRLQDRQRAVEHEVEWLRGQALHRLLCDGSCGAGGAKSCSGALGAWHRKSDTAMASGAVEGKESAAFVMAEA